MRPVRARKVVGSKVVGSKVVGSEVVRSQVVGSEVVRSQVVGSEVVRRQVVGVELCGGIQRVDEVDVVGLGLNRRNLATKGLDYIKGIDPRSKFEDSPIAVDLAMKLVERVGGLSWMVLVPSGLVLDGRSGERRID